MVAARLRREPSMALSDTQLVVLSAACRRPHGKVYPLPLKLPGGAVAKVLASLLRKGLIAEVEARHEDTVWREDKKHGALTLRATAAAFEALGIAEAIDRDAMTSAVEEGTAAVRSTQPNGNETSAAVAGTDASKENTTDDSAGETEEIDEASAAQTTDEADGGKRPPRRVRTDSKQAKLIGMLRHRDGATIEEIAKAFDWQPHTVRGAIAGALKRKLGLNVASEKDNVRGRVYRIIE